MSVSVTFLSSGSATIRTLMLFYFLLLLFLFAKICAPKDEIKQKQKICKRKLKFIQNKIIKENPKKYESTCAR